MGMGKSRHSIIRALGSSSFRYSDWDVCVAEEPRGKQGDGFRMRENALGTEAGKGKRVCFMGLPHSVNSRQSRYRPLASSGRG